MSACARNTSILSTALALLRRTCVRACGRACVRARTEVVDGSAASTPPKKKKTPHGAKRGGTSKTEWKTEVVDDSAASTNCRPIVVIRANLKETTEGSLGSLRVVTVSPGEQC